MTLNPAIIGVVALIAAIATSMTGATTALATSATAAPFELTLEYQVPSWEVPNSPVTGTFAARPPFCGSGAFVELGTRVGAADAKYRLTCDDGSGSLVVSASASPFDHVFGQPVIRGSWKVIEGTGRYAGLRGTGLQRSELSEDALDPECADVVDPFDPGVFCPWIVTWRSTLEGVVAEDAVAPKVGFSRVKVTKLARPAGAYSVGLAIALRDDVEGSPVSYLLRVTPTTSARELARSFGTTRDGTASMTMRVRYYKPPKRAVLLRLSASDEVGNESSASQVVRLPR